MSMVPRACGVCGLQPRCLISGRSGPIIMPVSSPVCGAIWAPDACRARWWRRKLPGSTICAAMSRRWRRRSRRRAPGPTSRTARTGWRTARTWPIARARWSRNCPTRCMIGCASVSSIGGPRSCSESWARMPRFCPFRLTRVARCWLMARRSARSTVSGSSRWPTRGPAKAACCWRPQNDISED